MSGAIRVLLPPPAAHLSSRVLEAGCTPVVDATGPHAPDVPEGAWVRTRPGRPAPGTGPVVLAELGAPVPGRETWLETSLPRDVPKGYAGLILKGREAGGWVGEEDGLVALSRCPDPTRVVLDAGVGPATAAAAASLNAAGVLLVEPHLGCPELALPPGMVARMGHPDDEITHLIGSLRVCASPTAPVLRRLGAGEDPWSLAAGLWTTGDPSEHLWLAGQGITLAGELADRFGTLGALLAAYREAWLGWTSRARHATASPAGRTVGTASGLASPHTTAGVGGPVGSSVLWQEAIWLGRAVHGGPLRAALATGGAVVTTHGDISEELADLPQAPVTTAAAPPPSASPATPSSSTDVPAPSRHGSTQPAAAIAIIGIGCRFPGGSDSVDAFWANIVGGVSAIGEVPHDRWDPALYYDPDHEAPDKTYSRIGGFLTDFTFDSKRFRIPPKVAKQVDPVQQITLSCVADALEDAGLKVDRRSDGQEFDRERCAVILGNSLGGEVSDRYAIRLAWPDVAKKLVAVPPFCNLEGQERIEWLQKLELAYKAGLPVVDEDSMPGELANVIAGRIANAFDLGGANFTVDAACASSMAAVQSAIASLQSGESDLVVTGGADRSMNIATYVKFAKIGALSPDHSSPFDHTANGFVMGEGCGILVLKRYEDAVRDGDRVYAVVRGVGASSDGRGKGITAPNLKGQLRALRRAYDAAGFDPWQVDLVEAHGTSTVVGDKVEVEALSEVMGGGHRAERGPIRIGSVKSMIGHLKSAAGAASIIKAALALHHGVLPPSLGFHRPSADVPLDSVPLQVQTRAEPWPETPDGLRRAGVSAFGFGGTNFHVVLESFAGQPLPASVTRTPPLSQPLKPSRPHVAAEPQAAATVVLTPSPAIPLPDGIWATSALSIEDLVGNLERLERGEAAPWNPSAPLRISAAARDGEERTDQLARALRTLRKGSNTDMLRARAIHFEDAPFNGRLALLFTGQGSQYLDMGLDLAAAYPIVSDTLAEADRILTPTLGKGITDYIRLSDGEDADAKSDLLRQTEYSQPATLTLDVGILRLLGSYGVLPDLVAGHSLGEYGAAVAAGVMTFEQALLAVSARGREMASIRLDDPGKMAGIAASTKVVEEVLAEVDGYVIAANKNCPSQTVIAGASDAVDEAAERFRARGITVYLLPVSHAFHSQIVAPASEPLRGVLGRLGLQTPRRPITTNVTGDYYPSGPGSTGAIIDLLAQQISAPVEWTAQMERMYADGARVFVECGPKRALSGFTVAILKRRPHRALYTNHPKRGGVASFRDSLAGLIALGLPVRAEPMRLADVDLFGAPEPRKATTQAITAYTELQRTSTEAIPAIEEGILRIVARISGYEADDLNVDDELEADLGIDTVKQAEVFSVVRQTYGIAPDPEFTFADHRTLRSLIAWAAKRTGATRISVTPKAQVVSASVAPAAPVVADDVVATFLTQAAKAGVEGLDGAEFASALLPAVQGLLAAAFQAARASTPVPAPALAQAVPPAPATAPPAPLTRLPGQPAPIDPSTTIVVTGASVGLPGGDEVFGASNFSDILSGHNRISHLGERAKKFLELGLVRLVKDPQTGQGSFLPVSEESEVIRLAGTNAGFDISAYGIDPRLVRALDITTQLSFAAAFEALRDAGIPMVRRYKESASGKPVPQGWGLPESLRDGTAVIFASAFPGYDQLLNKVEVGGDDGEGHFDRRFLFQVLSMGHSQLAQVIGARGPNAALNAACASSTQALALAEDWIRLGRCDRVVIVGADDVTSDALLPWIGGGFMAAGAATTHDEVTEAALPFDARRHGMILGMGAVGMVIERARDAAARGVVPIAEQLGTTIVNSAFHGTRLDTDHIADAMSRLVADIAEREGLQPSQLAPKAMFMSHETYTPARGGSAAAEITALRRAFGDAANQISIANTKGYTGHAMGAGIEDAVALKALQYGIVPPIPNLLDPDPELGDLRLSRGERRELTYAVRLAAGFGSQLAIAVFKAVAQGDARVSDVAVRRHWLQQVTGYAHVEEHIEHRTLRAVPADVDSLYDLAPDISPATSVRLPTDGDVAAQALSVPAAAATAPPAAGSPPSHQEVLDSLVALVATKTGYEPAELESDFELEADLGIDTVKQAEILGELTDHYGLERDDDFRMADYPTLEALAGYLMGAIAGAGRQWIPGTSDRAPERSAAPTPSPAPTPTPAPLPEPPPTPRAAAPLVMAASASGSVLDDLVAVVADKTGYEPDELELDFELEADLGIDTVKQAEILGELTERYGLERDEGFRLADHPTLEALAAYLDARRGHDASAPGTQEPAIFADLEAPVEDEVPVDIRETFDPRETAPTPISATRRASRETAEPAQLAGPEFDETLAELISVVAQTSGYDTDDLEPEFELEADLGIDTVKQAEILSQLQERYALPRDDEFRPADYDTLYKLAQYVHARRELPEEDTDAGATLARVIAPSATIKHDPLGNPVLLDSGPDDHLDDTRADGPISVLPLGEESEETVEDPPTQPSSGRAYVPEEFDMSVGGDRKPITSPPLPASFRIRSPVLQPTAPPAGALWADRRARVLGDGELAAALRQAVIERGGALDGPFDTVIDAGDDVSGSFHLAQECDATRPTTWLTVTRLGGLDGADPGVQRALTDGARAGFTKSLGREWDQTSATVVDVHPDRTLAETAASVLDELGADANEVFIAADGGRYRVGLVSLEAPESATIPDRSVVLVTGGGRGISARIALELARRGPVRLALVGRSAAGASPLDEPKEKKRIKAELKVAGERVTPAKVEAVLAPMRKAEEIRLNLEELRSHGARAEYLQADLADADSVRAMVQQVTDSFGPIAVAIHGAGVEESRLLGDKDDSAFRRVFDGKALGGKALLEAIPADAFAVGMGSVAGRFGNPGQVDYAAANDALCRMCLARPNSLHVDWTAWDDVGMAVRGSMRNLLEERGVQLLPADAGAALLVDLVAHRLEGEFVVAGALGDFEPGPAHALLDTLELSEDRATATRELTVGGDPWIGDHSIDDVPVLPGVIGLELMAACAAHLFPEGHYQRARDVRFEAPVKVHGSRSTTLVVEAERTTRPGEARARLVSVRTLRTGRVRRTEHFSATVCFGASETLPDGLPSAFLPDETVDAAGIYRRFFHGPLFQVLHGVFGVSRDGLVAEGAADDTGIGPDLSTSPLTLEAAFQAAGLHRMIVAHEMGLPLEIAEVHLLGRPDPDERFSLMVHLADDGTYNVDVDGVGGPLMRLRGFAMIDRGPVPTGDRFPEPEQDRPRCFPVTTSRSGGRGVATAEARADDDPHALLTAEELMALRSRGTERRVRDRIAGRLAAKRALAALTGVDPLQIRVDRAESGAPIARVPGHPAAQVSLSHRDGHAVAVAVAAGRVGVDLERVEARAPSFATTWLSDGERVLAGGDPVRQTVLWAVKEAVLKLVGTGLACSPHDIEVTALTADDAQVILTGEVAAHHQRFGGGPLVIRWAHVSADEVVISVRMAA